MRFKWMIVTAPLLLCACSFGGGNDTSSWSSVSDESLVVCSKSTSLSNSERERLDLMAGNYVYCWKDGCEAYKCVSLKATLGDNFPLLSSLIEAQSGLSCSLEDMAAILSTKTGSSGLVNAVFEISAHMDESSYAAFAACPYTYICQDHEVYTKLGLQETYEYGIDCGYVFEDGRKGLPQDSDISRAALKEFDALFFGDYAVVTLGAVNHLFTFSSEMLSSHEEIPFVLFDGGKANEAVGLDFKGLIQKYGCPAFLSEDNQEGVDYIYGNRAYRFAFSANAVSAVSELSINSALVVEDENKMLSASDASAFPSKASIGTIIKKFGKPTFGFNRSVPSFAYRLENGKYLKFLMVSYSCRFDYLQRGFYVDVVEQIDALPR